MNPEQPKVRRNPNSQCWLVDEADDLDRIVSREELEARRELELGDIKSKFDREDSVL